MSQNGFSFAALPPLSLYVHLPWCARKCPYCDFNSHEARTEIPEADYIAALIADLENDLPRVWGRPVRSIFIGGGTPSLFSPEAIERLLAAVHARLAVAPDAEITLEANPGTVAAPRLRHPASLYLLRPWSRAHPARAAFAHPCASELERFRGYRAAGVNRLSIGVQSFDDEKLKALDRIHDRDQALRAAAAARAAGFDNVADGTEARAAGQGWPVCGFADGTKARAAGQGWPVRGFADGTEARAAGQGWPVRGFADGTEARAAGHGRPGSGFNLDLMFGLPGQTVEQALADVRLAIAQQPAHLSVYQLTIEPNTLFHAQPPTLPDDDTLWAMQEQLQALLAANGYRQYEVSAYARAGHECRHNLNYWRFGDYLGLGAGAHAKITDANGVTRLWKVKQPEAYLGTAGTAHATGGIHTLTAKDVAFEFMLNALRLTEGFPAALFEERTGLPLDTIEPALRVAETKGLVARGTEVIRPTETGRRLLNDLLQLFLP